MAGCAYIFFTGGPRLLGPLTGWLPIAMGFALPTAVRWYVSTAQPWYGPDLLARPARVLAAMRRSERSWFGVGGRQGLVLGVLATAFAVWLAWGMAGSSNDKQALQQRGVTVQAHVAQIWYDDDNSPYRIDVAYRLDGGSGPLVQHQVSQYGSTPNNLRRGAAVAVVYDPRHPSLVMFKSAVRSRFDGAWWFLIIPIGLAALGFRMWRRKESFPEQDPGSRMRFGVSV